MMSKPALQNADTEWKNAIQTPCHPKCIQNTGIINSAPAISIINTRRKIKPISLTTPPIWWLERLSWSRCRWNSVIFRPDTAAKNAVMVMMPRPPICMRIRMTACPKVDQ